LSSLRINGIDIYYEVRGEGEPLMIISGLGTDVSQIDSLVEGFSRTHRVIAFDNRGVGRTDKPDVPYTIEMMAEDAAGLLRALGVSRCNVLGFSMGGRIALSLALEHPELVKSLILAMTSAKMNYDRGILWTLSNLLLRIPAVRAIGTKYPQPYYAYVRQRDASRGFDVTSRLRGIKVPTIIIQGKKDKFVPTFLAEEIHSGIAGSSLVRVEGSHTFALTNQKEFVRLVAGLLNQSE
jgi:pimeloyl-ACP methyl ester carboxylesterase